MTTYRRTETMPKLHTIFVAMGLSFAASSGFAQDTVDQVILRARQAATTTTVRMTGPARVGSYAMCRGAVPIMSMITMMGRTLYSQHTEGCLAFMKGELQIAESQASRWNEFVEAVRGNVETMTELYESMMLLDDPSTTMPQRLALEEKTMTSHLARVKRIEHSAGDLYAVLSEEQKTAARRMPLVQLGIAENDVRVPRQHLRSGPSKQALD
jgi:hypothetical protein